MRRTPRILFIAAATCLSALVHTDQSGPIEWSVERAILGRSFGDLTDRSLAIDASGCLHVAYGWNHLFHARYDGERWHYEIVDSSLAVGRYASLALDPGERPHISYHDGLRDD